VDEVKLRVLLIGLGIVATILSIVKTTMEILDRIEAKRKPHNRKKPSKRKRK